ncbi:hypothetical protein F4604DRAFT_1686401 [Suillus subluteus]|nr:hypothetical protein F4604DRAFT_1686401 [Suillus subluteus]
MGWTYICGLEDLVNEKGVASRRALMVSASFCINKVYLCFDIMKRNYFRIDICIRCGRENLVLDGPLEFEDEKQRFVFDKHRGVLDRNAVQWEVEVKPGSLADLWDFSEIDDIDDFGDFNDCNDFSDFDDLRDFDDFSEFNNFNNFRY